MKKLFACILMMCLMLVCLPSCSKSYEENAWFVEEKLESCLVPDLPEIDTSYVKENNERIYVKFTETEYTAYLDKVYEYLKSQDFKYFGTRGRTEGVGMLYHYYFKPVSELSEFKNFREFPK